MLKFHNLAIIIYFVSYSNVAYAYLGPGMGGGFIAAFFGIIIAIILAIFGLIWFPLKRLFKNNSKKNKK